MPHKLTLHAKDFAGTAMQNGKIVALVSAGAIASQKFLDLKELATKFNMNIEVGSTTEKILDHQGAIKVAITITAMHFMKNKMDKHAWLKWIMIGLMLQGALQEINQLTGDKAGQIGESNLDEEFKKAAEEIKAGLHGNELIQGNPTTEYVPSVQGNPTTEYVPSVQGAFEESAGVSGNEDYAFMFGEDEEM
jgi:hypothetical protein